MKLPFSQQQFYDGFTAYHHALWAAPYLLNALALAMVLLLWRAPERAGRWVSLGLAGLWAWQALAYHLAFFWAVNPAAPFFAGVALAASAAFLAVGVLRPGLRFQPGRRRSAWAGLLLVVFALLVYPAIGEWQGPGYPAAPSFGLPCPTTLFTFGILLMAVPPPPRLAVIAPLLWASIGSVAAWALDVVQDFGLFVAVALGLHMLLHSQGPAVSSSTP